MFGPLLKWSINAWIASTGRVCTYEAYPWLEGPMAEGAVIGPEFYRQFAASAGLQVNTATDAGLIDDFSVVLPQADGSPALNPRIAHFYEHTAAYKLEVWSQWYPPFSFFARVLIRTLSAKMNQLNIPLHPLETSRGMSNEVIQLKDPATGQLKYACWLRRSIRSGRVVYAGFYSACAIGSRPYVRVVFPLPDGNVTVLLAAIVQPDGSVKLVSDGRRIGDAGYYRLRRHRKGSVRVKYIPLKETIHVFEDEEGTLRTDHGFVFLGRRLLHLHYKIMSAFK